MIVRSIHLHAKGHGDEPQKPPGAPDRTPVKDPGQKIPKGDPKDQDKNRERLKE